MHLDQRVTCPVCEEGTLSESIGERAFTYKGKDFVVTEYRSSTCDVCGTEIVLPQQAKNNDQQIRNSHREIDGLLTGEAIRQIRMKLSLSQSEAAFLFGGGVHAFSKYERGEVTQSLSMDRLLRLVYALPSTYETLEKIARIHFGYSLKSKKFQSEAECGYGTCGFGTTKPGDLVLRNVQSIDHYRLKKRQVLTNDYPSGEYDQVVG